MTVYERPELMELGKAEEVTLGSNGTCADNCGCAFPNAPDQQLGAS